MPIPGVVASSRVSSVASGLLNHAAIAAPRNATNTHTVTPSSGTLAAGTLFTPTAGRFLLCVVEGSVTTTGAAGGTGTSPPTGWTLPTNGSAVNATGLYVFTKTAAGSDTMIANHNGTNYPVSFDFYEFSAGTTFVGAVTATSVGTTVANPNLTGLTGTTNIVMAAKGQGGIAAVTTGTWNLSMTESLDACVNASDGYFCGVGYLTGYSTSSFQPTCTLAPSAGIACEALTWAVKP
jgi:hypothetical protein